jgi:ribosome biogenesis GTPase A
MLGSVNDEILNIDELAVELVKLLQEHFPEVIAERYQIEKQEEPLKVLEEIARVRACLLKGNELDISKAANILIDDFRSGRLGKLTIEFPTISE